MHVGGTRIKIANSAVKLHEGVFPLVSYEGSFFGKGERKWSEAMFFACPSFHFFARSGRWVLSACASAILHV